MPQRVRRGQRRDRELLQERAAEAERARLAVHRTAQARNAGRPETYADWHHAVDVFRAAISAAYPADFWTVMGHRYERLAQGEPDAVEMAVHFLEADLWFFRSGYVKEELIRRLTRLEVTPALASRLRQVVVQVVERRDRREFRRYCRLAQRLADADLVTALHAHRQSADPGIRRRAEWMLAAVEHRPVDAGLMEAQEAWYRGAWDAAAAGVDFEQSGWWKQLTRPLPHQPRQVQYGYGDPETGGWRLQRHRKHGRQPESP